MLLYTSVADGTSEAQIQLSHFFEELCWVSVSLVNHYTLCSVYSFFFVLLLYHIHIFGTICFVSLLRNKILLHQIGVIFFNVTPQSSG